MNASVNCFFCQDPVEIKFRSKEHIIPRWLMKRANLNDMLLTFSDGTKTKYSKLTVPACALCNNIFGSTLENDIKNIFDNYDLYVKELTSNDNVMRTQYSYDTSIRSKLITWLSKLFYGLLYFETTLANRPPRSPRLDSRDLNEHLPFKLMRGSILGGKQFYLESSLFVFTLPRNSDVEFFDLLDSPYPAIIGLKVGNKFLVLTIADGGLVGNFCNGTGLERLRNDVYEQRFGSVSYLMAYSYLYAVYKNLPKSPSFITIEDQIINMSNWTLRDSPPELDVFLVNKLAIENYMSICKSRGIPGSVIEDDV